SYRDRGIWFFDHAKHGKGIYAFVERGVVSVDAHFVAACRSRGKQKGIAAIGYGRGYHSRNSNCGWKSWADRIRTGSCTAFHVREHHPVSFGISKECIWKSTTI